MHISSAIIASTEVTDTLPLDRIFPDGHRPLEVDVGCGKGRFLLARAQAHPSTNFLGIDRLMKRLRLVDARIIRSNLSNVRLLYVDALYMVASLLPAASVTAFYIFFPDPWPKRRHHRRRLFSPTFLDALDRTLLPDGQVNVATDHGDYFAEISKLLQRDPRFVEAPIFQPSEAERTHFELTFMNVGAPIFRLAVRKRETREQCQGSSVEGPKSDGK